LNVKYFLRWIVKRLREMIAINLQVVLVLGDVAAIAECGTA